MIVPDRPAPSGGRPIVSWAHPTTGSAPRCGPSLDFTVLRWRPPYTADEMNAILTPEGQAAIPRVEALCLLTENKEIHAITDPLIGNFVTSDPATSEPRATMLRENSAGGSPIGVPIFVAQGLADKLVVPAVTEA